MLDLREQIEDDDDIKQGWYFFDIQKCSMIRNKPNAKQVSPAHYKKPNYIEQGDQLVASTTSLRSASFNHA